MYKYLVYLRDIFLNIYNIYAVLGRIGGGC